MKPKILIKQFTLIMLPCFISTILFAQTISDPSVLDPNYNTKKLSLIQNNKAKNNAAQKNAAANLAPAPCNIDNNCFIPTDASYTAVGRNDDGSFGPISLPFNFNLYGSSYNRVWINTNGNLTFDTSLSQYMLDVFLICI